MPVCHNLYKSCMPVFKDMYCTYTPANSPRVPRGIIGRHTSQHTHQSQVTWWQLFTAFCHVRQSQARLWMLTACSLSFLWHNIIESQRTHHSPAMSFLTLTFTSHIPGFHIKSNLFTGANWTFKNRMGPFLSKSDLSTESVTVNINLPHCCSHRISAPSWPGIWSSLSLWSTTS